MRTILCVLGSAGLTAGLTLPTPSEPQPRSPEAILEAYVEDFRRDREAATARTFGIRVEGEGGGTWTIESAGTKLDDDSWSVTLRAGAPAEPTFVYTVDATTLRAIDAGQINALTAQGKAFAGDFSPMTVTWMDGAEEFDERPFSFHFWTRGFPEKVPFGPGLTREVHGADNVVFYYREGLRTAFSRLEKGDRVNNGPGQPMIIPFPIMVFIISGRGRGVVGDTPVVAGAGEMMFIPPMTPYEWWNEEEEPAEAILVMFGEGA